MANARQTRILPVLVWVAVLALLFAVIYATRSLTRDVVQVKVTRVTYQTLASTASTNGKVEPVFEFQAHAPFAGVVKKIYVDVGQKVRTGQLLVAMDDADAKARIATMRANVASSQLALDQLQQGGTLEERTQFANNIRAAQLDQTQAQQNLATLEQLQAKGAASAGEVKAAQQRLTASTLTLENAQKHKSSRYGSIDIATAQAHLNDARAGLQASEDAMANVLVHSPLNGTVYSIPVSEYDFVPGGDDLLDVADLNRIQVRAYFDEPEIGKLDNGQPVRIVWDAKPNSAWHGHILRAPTTVITYGTRNVGECIITVDDANGDLLPNTNVTVTVTEVERKNVLTVPREALHTEGTSSYVFRIVNGKLVRTPVQVGIFNQTTEQIVSGLKDNDLVVLAPLSSGQDLTDGLEVKAVQ